MLRDRRANWRVVWYSNRQRRWDITERVTTGGSAWSSFAHVLAADVFFLHNQYIHNNYLYFGIEQSTYAHYKCLSLGLGINVFSWYWWWWQLSLCHYNLFHTSSAELPPLLSAIPLELLEATANVQVAPARASEELQLLLTWNGSVDCYPPHHHTAYTCSKRRKLFKLPNLVHSHARVDEICHTR